MRALRLLLLLLAAGSARGQAQVEVQRAWMMVRSGRLRMALPGLRDALDADPDNVDLHAIYGTALSRLTLYSDAWAELDLAVGSPYYDRDGIDARADAMRYFGQPRQAAELRRQRALVVDGDPAVLLAIEGAITDLRYAGDLDAAWELCWEAESLRPGAATSHACLAQVALDLGDREEADAWLWQASLTGQHPLALQLLRTRVALLDGEMEAADVASVAALTTHRQSREALAVRAEVLRQQGRAEEASELLEQPRWGAHEFPPLMAVQTMVLADLGESAGAREIFDRALALYPGDPDIAVARRHLAR